MNTKKKADFLAKVKRQQAQRNIDSNLQSRIFKPLHTINEEQDLLNELKGLDMYGMQDGTDRTGRRQLNTWIKTADQFTSKNQNMIADQFDSKYRNGYFQECANNYQEGAKMLNDGIDFDPNLIRNINEKRVKVRDNRPELMGQMPKKDRYQGIRQNGIDDPVFNNNIDDFLIKNGHKKYKATQQQAYNGGIVDEEECEVNYAQINAQRAKHNPNQQIVMDDFNVKPTNNVLIKANKASGNKEIFKQGKILDQTYNPNKTAATAAYKNKQSGGRIDQLDEELAQEKAMNQAFGRSGMAVKNTYRNQANYEEEEDQVLAQALRIKTKHHERLDGVIIEQAPEQGQIRVNGQQKRQGTNGNGNGVIEAESRCSEKNIQKNMLRALQDKGNKKGVQPLEYNENAPYQEANRGRSGQIKGHVNQHINDELTNEDINLKVNAQRAQQHINQMNAQRGDRDGVQANFNIETAKKTVGKGFNRAQVMALEDQHANRQKTQIGKAQNGKMKSIILDDMDDLSLVNAKQAKQRHQKYKNKNKNLVPQDDLLADIEVINIEDCD